MHTTINFSIGCELETRVDTGFPADMHTHIAYGAPGGTIRTGPLQKQLWSILTSLYDTEIQVVVAILCCKVNYGQLECEL